MHWGLSQSVPFTVEHFLREFNRRVDYQARIGRAVIDTVLSVSPIAFKTVMVKTR
jgi:hypothetical protein